MDGFKPPKPLSFDGNLANNWRTWMRELTLYMDATEASSKSDKVQANILLHCIGSKSRKIYDTFTFSAGDEMKYKPVLGKSEEYCSPKKNLTLLRFQFFTYRQEEEQPFDDFVTHLRKLCKECGFGELHDSLLKDIIIIGLCNKRLQERLLREPDISLATTIQHCQANEVSKKHAKTCENITRSLSATIYRISSST